MIRRFVIKAVSTLTLLFFSISNISYAAAFPTKNSSLRSMSLAVSGVDRGIIASLSYSEYLKPEVEDGGDLESILGQILKRQNEIEGRDIHIDWGRWTGKDEDIIKLPQLVHIPSVVPPTEHLQIPSEFINDYESFYRKNIVLKVNFGDGKTENISLAREFAERGLGHALGDLGVRYDIVKSAIWLWYHFIYKNKDDAVRRNNRLAWELLDKVFYYVNNPKKFEDAVDPQIKNVIKFREQIPALLPDSRFYTEREKVLKLQEEVKRIILLINALWNGESVPKDVNLLDVPDNVIKELILPETTRATLEQTERFTRQKIEVNSRGFRAIIDGNNRADIHNVDNIPIIKNQDVSNGFYFTDDGGYAVCVGSKRLRVFNLYYASAGQDTPVVEQKFSQLPNIRFFNKGNDGRYNYIVVSFTVKRAGIPLSYLMVYNLRTKARLVKESGEFRYRILGNGRYLEIGQDIEAEDTEEILDSIVKLYDFKRPAFSKDRLSPIVTKKGGSDTKGIMGFGFDSNVVEKVAYGTDERQLVFNSDTAVVLSPETVDPTQKYDGKGPKVDLATIKGTAIDATAVKHKGWAAIYWSKEEAPDGKKHIIRKALSSIFIKQLYKLLIFSSEGKPVIKYPQFQIQNFWFSPDGRQLVVYDKDGSVVLIDLQEPEISHNLGKFVYLVSVRYTDDNRHIILSGRAETEFTTIPQQRIFNVEDTNNIYSVVDFDGVDKQFFFGAYYAPGTENIICECKGNEIITIDRRTGEAVNISLPEVAEREKVPQPLETHCFGQGEGDNYKYRLEIYGDHLVIKDLDTEAPIIDVECGFGGIDYRIIEGDIIEIIDDYKLTHTIYDLRYPEKPLLKGKKQTAADFLKHSYSFSPEVIDKVVCLYSPGKDFGEEYIVFDVNEGKLTIPTSAYVKPTKNLSEEQLEDILASFEYNSYELNQPNPDWAYYEIKLKDTEDKVINTLRIYSGPSGKEYIVCKDDEKGDVSIRDLKNPKRTLLAEYLPKDVEISDDGNFIVAKTSAKEPYQQIYRYVEGRLDLIATIASTKEGFLFWFPEDSPSTPEKLVKRIAAQYKNGKRLWLDHSSKMAMFTAFAGRVSDKRPKLTFEQFAQKLGYPNAMTLLAEPENTDSSGHYYFAKSKKATLVAKLFPKENRLKQLIKLDEEIISHQFIGPNSEWFITEDKDKTLRVYNLEADIPQQPIYECQLNNQGAYVYDTENFRLAMIDAINGIRVIELSNPSVLLRDWRWSDLGLPRNLRLDGFGPDYFFARGYSKSFFSSEDGFGTYKLNIKTGKASDLSKPEVEPGISSAAVAKSSSAGKTTTAEVYKMLIKASDKKIAELLRTLHTRKFRVREITPYLPAAKIISDKAAGDSQKATQLIDGFARHIKILTKNRLSGVAVNYELGEKKQILTFNDRGWKFYTREEWRRKLSSWNYFPIDATDGMGIYYPSDESSARQISYFKSKDPYEYETEPEFAWVRSPVNFTEVNIGLPKPLEAIIFISATKSSSAGEVKVGEFDFKVITDNEAFSSSVGPLTTVLKDNLSILRRRANLDLKYPDLPEHKQVVFANKGVFSELIKIPGSYPDASLVIAAIEEEKGQGIKQLAILVQERGQEAETYEIPCVKVFMIQPSIAQIENLGKKLATSATEEKKALSRYLKYLKQQTAAKSSSAGAKTVAGLFIVKDDGSKYGFRDIDNNPMLKSIHSSCLDLFFGKDFTPAWIRQGVNKIQSKMSKIRDLDTDFIGAVGIDEKTILFLLGYPGAKNNPIRAWVVYYDVMKAVKIGPVVAITDGKSEELQQILDDAQYPTITERKAFQNWLKEAPVAAKAKFSSAGTIDIAGVVTVAAPDSYYHQIQRPRHYMLKATLQKDFQSLDSINAASIREYLIAAFGVDYRREFFSVLNIAPNAVLVIAKESPSVEVVGRRIPAELWVLDTMANDSGKKEIVLSPVVDMSNKKKLSQIVEGAGYLSGSEKDMWRSAINKYAKAKSSSAGRVDVLGNNRLICSDLSAINTLLSSYKSLESQLQLLVSKLERAIAILGSNKSGPEEDSPRIAEENIKELVKNLELSLLDLGTLKEVSTVFPYAGENLNGISVAFTVTTGDGKLTLALFPTYEKPEVRGLPTISGEPDEERIKLLQRKIAIVVNETNNIKSSSAGLVGFDTQVGKKIICYPEAELDKVLSRNPLLKIELKRVIRQFEKVPSILPGKLSQLGLTTLDPASYDSYGQVTYAGVMAHTIQDKDNQFTFVIFPRMKIAGVIAQASLDSAHFPERTHRHRLAAVRQMALVKSITSAKSSSAGEVLEVGNLGRLRVSASTRLAELSYRAVTGHPSTKGADILDKGIVKLEKSVEHRRELNEKMIKRALKDILDKEEAFLLKIKGTENEYLLFAWMGKEGPGAFRRLVPILLQCESRLGILLTYEVLGLSYDQLAELLTVNPEQRTVIEEQYLNQQIKLKKDTTNIGGIVNVYNENLVTGRSFDELTFADESLAPKIVIIDKNARPSQVKATTAKDFFDVEGKRLYSDENATLLGILQAGIKGMVPYERVIVAMSIRKTADTVTPRGRRVISVNEKAFRTALNSLELTKQQRDYWLGALGWLKSCPASVQAKPSSAGRYRVVEGRFPHQVNIFDAERPGEKPIFTRENVRSYGLSPDEKYVVFVLLNERAEVYAFERLNQPVIRDQNALGFEFSPDGRRILFRWSKEYPGATPARVAKFAVRDLETGEVVVEDFGQVKFSRTGRYVGTPEGMVYHLDKKCGIGLSLTDGDYFKCIFSKDDTHLILLGSQTIRDIEQGGALEELLAINAYTLPDHIPTLHKEFPWVNTGFSISEDGLEITVVTKDKTATYSVITGKEIPQASTPKASSAGPTNIPETPIQADSSIRQPDSLGLAGKWEKEFGELMTKAQDISNGLVTETDLTQLKEFLDQPGFVDPNNQIIITLPDSYVFNPGLKEFAESVKDITIHGGTQPLFRFIIAVDNRLPDKEEIRELISQINGEGIIAAKIKTIEALKIPNLEIKTVKALFHKENPVEVAKLLIDEVLNLGEIRARSATKGPRVVMFQSPIVQGELTQDLMDEFDKLAKQKNVIFVLPEAERENQTFNVFTLLNSFFKDMKSILSNPFLKGVVFPVKLPKAESLEAGEKAEEFYQTLTEAVGCA